jgi:hypothetical protein
MAFVPAPQIVMAEIRALFAGQKIENRVMIDTLAAVTPAVVDDVANIVDVWAQASYFPVLPSRVVLNSVVATDMSAQDGSQHTITPEATVVGGLAAEVMPNETTFCIGLKSNSRGRSARGRFYVLGLARPDVTDNDLSAVRANSFVAALDDLIERVSTAGWRLVVVSYVTNNAPRPGGPVYYEIVNATFSDLVVDSMKSRKPGVGT